MPHGECNALLLEHVVRFNFASTLERYRRIADEIGIDAGRLTDTEYSKALVSALSDLRSRVGIVGGLAQRGVRPEDLPELAGHAVKDACIFTNPRRVSLADAQAIYADAF
jgi:alcohol dehydrogenase